MVLLWVVQVGVVRKREVFFLSLYPRLPAGFIFGLVARIKVIVNISGALKRNNPFVLFSLLIDERLKVAQPSTAR